MMKKISQLLIVASLVIGATGAFAQCSVKANEAAKHANEVCKVQGKVVSVVTANKVKGNPTYLNFEQAYPDQVFTVVVWAEDAAKFKTSLKDLQGKQVAVNGKIKLFKNKPQITVAKETDIAVIQ